MTELIVGEVTGEDGDAVNIRAPIPENVEAWGKQRPSKVLLKFCDGRKASPEQVKKAHALIGEIAEWMGDTPEFVKIALKRKFILTKLDEMETGMFSFRDCDMEKARLFITFLIDLMVEYGIPSKRPLYEQAEDIGAYVYACCMNKTCCVCGRKGVDLHHVLGSIIGMGGDRTKVNHLGREVLPLCRGHHNEAHNGEKDFMKRYHLEPIKVDETIAKLYRLNTKERR
jgi:hypothetical protein